MEQCSHSCCKIRLQNHACECYLQRIDSAQHTRVCVYLCGTVTRFNHEKRIVRMCGLLSKLALIVFGVHTRALWTAKKADIEWRLYRIFWGRFDCIVVVLMAFVTTVSFTHICNTNTVSFLRTTLQTTVPFTQKVCRCVYCRFWNVYTSGACILSLCAANCLRILWRGQLTNLRAIFCVSRCVDGLFFIWLDAPNF